MVGNVLGEQSLHPLPHAKIICHVNNKESEKNKYMAKVN